MNVFIYNPRFNLNYIAKAASAELKSKYRSLLELINLEPIEANLDIEDWIESITPIIHLIEKYELSNIFINSKEFTNFITESEKTEILNVISVGLYQTHEKIKIAMKDFNVNILFPHNNPDFEGFTYFRTRTFKEFSNRNIHGVFAAYDNEELDLLLNIKAFKEGILDSNSTEYSRVIKSIESSDKLQNLSNTELDKKILKLNEWKNHSFEEKLSKLSFNQEEESKKYFFKTIDKFIATSITLKKNSNIGQVVSEILNEIDYSYEKLLYAHLGYTVLIQDFADIEYEYRFFVINNKVVAGAACIEQFTPENNIHSPFDYQIVKKRNKDKIEENKKIVSELTKAAKVIAKSFKSENKFFKNYILDIGMINGKPGIIEVNPFKNVGFYALDYNMLLNEFINMHEKFSEKCELTELEQSILNFTENKKPMTSFEIARGLHLNRLYGPKAKQIVGMTIGKMRKKNIHINIR